MDARRIGAAAVAVCAAFGSLTVGLTTASAATLSENGCTATAGPAGGPIVVHRVVNGRDTLFVQGQGSGFCTTNRGPFFTTDHVIVTVQIRRNASGWTTLNTTTNPKVVPASTRANPEIPCQPNHILYRTRTAVFSHAVMYKGITRYESTKLAVATHSIPVSPC